MIPEHPLIGPAAINSVADESIKPASSGLGVPAIVMLASELLETLERQGLERACPETIETTSRKARELWGRIQLCVEPVCDAESKADVRTGEEYMKLSYATTHLSSYLPWLMEVIELGGTGVEAEWRKRSSFKWAQAVLKKDLKTLIESSSLLESILSE